MATITLPDRIQMQTTLPLTLGGIAAFAAFGTRNAAKVNASAARSLSDAGHAAAALTAQRSAVMQGALATGLAVTAVGLLGYGMFNVFDG